MGKKPVLGLVGLCVGLALSGCKNCSCWSKKSADGHPVARVHKDDTRKHERQARHDEVDEVRPRSVASKTPAPVKGDHPYDFGDSYNAQNREETEPAASRVTAPETKDPFTGEETKTVGYKQIEKKDDTVSIPPPPPPPSSPTTATPVDTSKDEVLPGTMEAEKNRVLGIVDAPAKSPAPNSIPVNRMPTEAKPATEVAPASEVTPKSEDKSGASEATPPPSQPAVEKELELGSPLVPPPPPPPGSK